MNINSEQFNRAFAEFQSFGPRRRIPIEDRWRDILCDVDPREFTALKVQCEKVETVALHLAEQVRDKQIAEDIARMQLAQQFPFLTPERLSHTWSQATYFSLK